MKTARKRIVRATKESTQSSISKHIEKMKGKGWSVDQEFGGNCGCSYEIVVWFCK